jgi:hypothetical protein
VIADGNNVGNNVIPEIADLDIAQSCRGYFPHAISHYKAPWANKDPENLPVPKYPGQVGNQYLGREKLEAYYKPWIELKNKGVGRALRRMRRLEQNTARRVPCLVFRRA